MLTPTWITQAAWFTSSKSTCINLCFYYSLAELQKKKTSFFDNHSSSWVDEVVHDKAKYYWFSITCNYDGWCSWGQRLNKSGHVNLTQWQLWGKHWLQRKNGIDFKMEFLFLWLYNLSRILICLRQPIIWFTIWVKDHRSHHLSLLQLVNVYEGYYLSFFFFVKCGCDAYFEMILKTLN